MVDSSPQVMPLAAYLYEDLVQVPPPLGTASHRFRSAFSDLVREIRPKPVHPEPDAFVADIDAALVKKVFDIAK